MGEKKGRAETETSHNGFAGELPFAPPELPVSLSPTLFPKKLVSMGYLRGSPALVASASGTYQQENGGQESEMGLLVPGFPLAKL